MPDKTYKVVEIVGVAEESYAQATRNAIEKASKTLRNLDWFQVVEQRGFIKGGKVLEFQVTLKVGFRLEDTPAG
ncbi:MAG: dodecin [Candidatus Binatota bacterium]|jgi:flavin-binding protein dodecin|nr:dodecin [Candidatus Binatota bacterium]